MMPPKIGTRNCSASSASVNTLQLWRKLRFWQASFSQDRGPGIKTLDLIPRRRKSWRNRRLFRMCSIYTT
jgi:hypothetical protein